MQRTKKGTFRTLAWRGGGKKQRRGPEPLLVYMTDTERTADPEIILQRLRPGTVVIFRHYDAPDRLALGRRLARLCLRRGLIFVVAGDRRLARRLHAAGLHLPEGMIRRRHRFVPAQDTWPVSAAAHDEKSAQRAGRAGADLILLSPVFPTSSHPGRPALGLRRLAKVCRSVSVPVLALGGVGPATVRRVLATGAAGVAGIGGLPQLCKDPFGWRARRS